MESMCKSSLRGGIQDVSLSMVTYGCGSRFDKSSFSPIENIRHRKPGGGLWGSPIASGSSWLDHAKVDGFSLENGSLDTCFYTRYSGNTLVINGAEDLNIIEWRSYNGVDNVPDYEALQSKGIDAIYLTEKGYQKTKDLWMKGMDTLEGWDCECLVVFNPDSIIPSIANRLNQFSVENKQAKSQELT